MKFRSPTTNGDLPGSARVSLQQSSSLEKVRDGEDAIANARDARATQAKT